MHEDWANSTIVPLFKMKEDILICSSYRRVKLIEQVLKDDYEIVNIDNGQFGFIAGRTEAIFLF